MQYLLILIFLAASLLAELNHEKKLEELANSKYWHKLLHYKASFFGGYKSEVDNPYFFYSKKGKNSPLEEAKASYKAFTTDLNIKVPDNHPQCRFPERFRYMAKFLGLSVKKLHCKEFLWWKKNIKYDSVSLIFAGYYPNNPSSIFGHTFLKMNSDKTTNKFNRDITDYGIDFAARTDMDGGVKFAMYGVFGGYKGFYSIKPYYIKLNSYIKNDSRDVWEYKLSINYEELNRMISHMWELYYNSYFKYYFFRKNCSYQLMPLLEVAKPEWDLSSGYLLYALPTDTVKRLVNIKGAVSEMTYRPAYKRLMLAEFNRLKRREKKQLFKLLGGDLEPKEVENKRILETAIAKLRYDRFNTGKITWAKKSLLRKSLIQRAKLGGKTEDPLLKNKKYYQPDLSHQSYNLGLTLGHRRRGDSFGELSFRSGLHDILNSDYGYPKNSILEIVKGTLRFTKGKDGRSNKVNLEEFKLIEVMSLAPTYRLSHAISWNVAIKLYNPKDFYNDKALNYQMYTGGGITLPLTSTFDAFVLALMNVEFGKKLNKKYRLGPALRYGLTYSPYNKVKWVGMGFSFWDLNQDSNHWIRHQFETGISFFISKNFEFRALFDYYTSTQDHYDDVEEYKLVVNTFF